MTSDSMLSRGKLGFQDMVIVIKVYGSWDIVYNHGSHIEVKKMADDNDANDKKW